jgi:lipopolysaccharide export system ATP-binding protein
MKDSHLLKTQHLIKAYNGRRVVDRVDITVKKGEIVGLLGPNGAGKTTTFYMIVGVIAPDNGKIIFNDRNITNLAMYQRARRGIGYLAQETSVFLLKKHLCFVNLQWKKILCPF